MAPIPAPLGGLVRDALLLSLPAGLGLLVLAALGLLGVPATLGGWLVSLAAAASLAYREHRQLAAIAEWLAALPRAPAQPPLPELRGASAESLARPLAELGRLLAHQLRGISEQRRMVGTIIEALPDPILVVDRDLVVTQSNAAARRSFDAPARKVPLARMVRDAGVLAAVDGALSGTSAGGITFSPTHDLTKQFSCQVEPVDLGEGGQGALVAMREQTEQVMIERMRSDFVANASHEIRTPLASIQGFIETLRGPARDDAEARDTFLEIMAAEAARMARLIDDLLSLSRLELEAHQPPQQQCALAEILELVVERMQPVAATGRVTLRLELAEGLPPVVGDPDQLHQLLVNLVDNAIKYGGEDQTVRIVADALDAAPADSGPLAGRPSARVSIVDHGPGIAKEHLPRLTERFYRVNAARSRRLRGTGLGLAIAKHIVRRHRGHLAVASEPGRGSTFSVLLPVAAP